MKFWKIAIKHEDTYNRELFNAKLDLIVQLFYSKNFRGFVFREPLEKGKRNIRTHRYSKRKRGLIVFILGLYMYNSQVFRAKQKWWINCIITFSYIREVSTLGPVLYGSVLLTEMLRSQLNYDCQIGHYLALFTICGIIMVRLSAVETA